MEGERERERAFSFNVLTSCIIFVLFNCFFPVSQPKLKRICQDSDSKTNHEDIQKSQTFQQFVRSMDNEVKHLQDTEHFYNHGESTAHDTFTLCILHCNVIQIVYYVNFYFSDDVDYHNDCISKKTLNQLSSDVAKLKAKGAVDALNKNKLTLLINFAMRNVDVVKNLSAGPVSDSQFIAVFYYISVNWLHSEFLVFTFDVYFSKSTKSNLMKQIHKH